MRLTAQLLHELFEPGVLSECLDKRTDRIERRIVHLLFQILIVPGRKALIDPWLVVLGAEVGLTYEEVAGTEAFKGRKPALGLLQVTCKRINIGRFRRHN